MKLEVLAFPLINNMSLVAEFKERWSTKGQKHRHSYLA